MKAPETVTPAIATACAKLVPGSMPVFVNREPAECAVINKCTFNVRKYLETHTGEMVLGWEISVWEGVMIDCIGHAIVRNEKGLICISPSKYPDTQILFVPDPRGSFDFNDPMARMPTTQVTISARPDVRRLIEIEAQEREIKIKYPVSSGSVLMTSADATVLQKLEREKQRMMLTVALATNDHVSKCACGSGKKFRKCHRMQFEQMLRHL